MIRWKDPVAALVVFVALSRLGPSPADCVVPERTIPPPPPTSDLSTGWLVRPDSTSVGRTAPDPFALSAAPKASGGPALPVRAPGPAPSRPWHVTGLVGRRAAVLVKSDGSSVVVSVGQDLDSARVVGISSAGVELEDRGGRFLLKVR